MKSENICEIQIDDVAFGGWGIGRVNGLVHFVRGTLPGEKVLAKISSSHKRFKKAIPIEILRNSQFRIPGICPLAFSPGMKQNLTCPGCSYQHLVYEQEIVIKNRQLQNFLKKYIRPETFICEPVPSPCEYNYRNKITLHRQNNRLGYFAEDNKTVLDIESCPLAVKQINMKICEFRKNIAYPMRGSGDVLFRYSDGDSKCLVISEKHSHREEFVIEQTIFGNFKVSPSGFFQVNKVALNKALSLFAEILMEIKPDLVVDAYCGCGIFSIVAAKAGAVKVFACDIEKSSIKAANQNSHEHNVLKFCEFRSCDAKQIFTPEMEKKSETKSLLFLDPPRTGVSEETLKKILCMNFSWILYMSCSADTLARDLSILTKKYSLQRAVMIDFFPRTPHFESLILLKKVY